ncbi:hypothetical protein [Archaeoglobus veneficus]|nr:hypothetical protein [Archaeoglobus veneficus]
MAPRLRLKVPVRLIILAIILILCSSPSLALSQSDFKVAFVTYVYDYDKYIPRWDNVYKQGDTIKLYVGVENVNRGRAAAVDFVVVVKDPEGYVVDGKVVQKRVTGYQDEIYDVIEIGVKDDWINGKYQIDAYVFDVLNLSATYKSYNELYDKILYSGQYDLSIGTISRDEAPYVKKRLTFYVKPYTIPNQFVVFDARLEASALPEGASNTLKVTVINKIDEEGTITLKALVDGRVVDSKTVELSGYEVKVVSLEIPPLPLGTHLIQVKTDNGVLSRTLPVFVRPLLYDRPILIGDVKDGSVVYSPNNYILGSVGISEISDVDVDSAISKLKTSGYDVNREDAKKMLTNILAYLYKHYGKSGVAKVALLEGSDSRAEKVLPELLEIVKKDSGAPIEYVGVRGYSELKDVDIAIYVGGSVPKVGQLGYFFDAGGFLIVDNPLYWKDYREELERELLYIGGWKKVKTPEELYFSYYDLRIDRGIEVTISTEITLPPKLQYSELSVDKFISTAGEPIMISFKVKNVGKSGKEVVKVLVNGEPAYEEEVMLKTGEEKSISFEYVPEEEGSYKVEIPGTNLVKVFFVKAKTTGQLAPKPTPTPQEKRSTREGGALVVGSAALLAALVIARMLLRE